MSSCHKFIWLFAIVLTLNQVLSTQYHDYHASYPVRAGSSEFVRYFARKSGGGAARKAITYYDDHQPHYTAPVVNYAQRNAPVCCQTAVVKTVPYFQTPVVKSVPIVQTTLVKTVPLISRLVDSSHGHSQSHSSSSQSYSQSHSYSRHDSHASHRNYLTAGSRNYYTVQRAYEPQAPVVGYYYGSHPRGSKIYLDDTQYYYKKK